MLKLSVLQDSLLAGYYVLLVMVLKLVVLYILVELYIRQGLLDLWWAGLLVLLVLVSRLM